MSELPPDTIFRRADEVDRCEECETGAADVYMEQAPSGRWLLDIVHQCGKPSEVVYV